MGQRRGRYKFYAKHEKQEKQHITGRRNEKHTCCKHWSTILNQESWMETALTACSSQKKQRCRAVSGEIENAAKVQQQQQQTPNAYHSSTYTVITSGSNSRARTCEPSGGSLSILIFLDWLLPSHARKCTAARRDSENFGTLLDTKLRFRLNIDECACKMAYTGVTAGDCVRDVIPATCCGHNEIFAGPPICKRPGNFCISSAFYPCTT